VKYFDNIYSRFLLQLFISPPHHNNRYKGWMKR
jgi:hypothetical protein